MAKSFVKITLAAKCRFLFGTAIFLIIGSALVLPWLYMQAMVNEEARRAGGEITRLYLNEWITKHRDGLKPDEVARLFAAGDESGVRSGPTLLRLQPNQTLKAPAERSASRAIKTFLHESSEDLVQVSDADDRGRRIHRSYRAVRVTAACMSCHDDKADPSRQLRQSSLVGIIRADLPGEPSSTTLAISRLVIVGAGVLAFFLATLTFYFITQKLILSPVRKLKVVADKAAEGDLTVRSEIRTGDEFEQLGRSLDGMLQAITDTQEQLRAANRALDLKLGELTEANVALFESNRIKTEFLANVSHELRTPLNSIIGFAELLGDAQDERVQRYSSNILTSARMLLHIINDLLDLARIEAGKVRMDIAEVSVTDICETLVSLVTPLANKKNLRLTSQLAPGVPIIRTDAGKLQQILYNLIENAIKFTPAGGAVTVTVRCGERGDGVSLDVADTGPGISEADQAHIFEKFYQADRSVTREHSGAGLGLAIAKDLAGMLNGQLTLASKPGEGATFTLYLPPTQDGQPMDRPAKSLVS